MQETIRATVQLPTRIYQLAEQHQLGQFHVLYRRRFHRFLLWFLPGWLALVIITLGYDGYRLLLSYHAPNTPSAASPFAGTWVPVWADTAQLVLTLGVIVLGALGVNPFWGFKKRLYVMENGAVYTSGKKAEIVRWDEIEVIFWWKKRGISYLCRKNGSKFRMIEEMEKAQEISTTVAGAVAEQLLPNALAHYQKTGKVRFGPLWVTREGMANFSNVASWKTVPVISWAEIEDVRFEKGKLSIKVSKKWKYWDEGFMRAYKIPNPTVCLALVRQTVGNGRRAENRSDTLICGHTHFCYNETQLYKAVKSLACSICSYHREAGMQQQITQQSNAAVAPEPTRNVVRAYWIVVGVFLALLIGSFFLPEPLHDELLWHQSSPFYLLVSSTPLSYAYPFVWYAIFIWPFMYFPGEVWPRPKWKTLEKNRRRAVENRLSGRSTATFSLPEVFPLLPASLSVRIRRNWHATLIAGTIYTTLIGCVLLAFVSDWQFSIQSLAQRGEISGWTLLGSIFEALGVCLLIFPAITAFLFAPHQRLIATRDGLICYRGLRFSYIPWHEALLFAVIAEQKNTLIYELASSTSIIRWSSKPTWNYADTFPAATVGIAPLGLVRAENSTEEYQWQIRQLTAMVAAGTGLPLYDLR